MSLSRRDFIAGAATAAVLCTTGGVAFAAQDGEGLLRPPGGQDENAFKGGCIKCDRCRSACPTNCIAVAHVEDGLLSARTPKLNYHLGSCTFCDRCVDVCPTGVLKPLDPATQKIGLARLNTDRCVAWSNPGSCVKCAEACTYGAATIVDGIPRIDDDLCNGCGQCEYECPALVYTSLGSGSDRGIVVRTLADAQKEGA